MYSRTQAERDETIILPPRYDGNALRMYRRDALTNGVNEVLEANRKKEAEAMAETVQKLSPVSNEANKANAEENNANAENESSESSPTDASPVEALHNIFDKIGHEELLIGAIILTLAGENTDGRCTPTILALILLLALR